MIIYGTGSKRIKQESILCKCDNCEGTEHVVEIHQKYASVFWIPLFPIGKPTYAVCTNCQKVSEYKLMTPNLKENADRIKTHTPIAIWSFAGVGLIAIAIGIFSFMNMKEFKAETNYILDPQLYDVMVLKEDLDEKESVTLESGETIMVDEEYFYAMIVDTLGDSVDLIFSAYSWYGSVPTRSDYKNEFENEDDTWIDSLYYTYGKSELIDLHKEKAIIDIFR